MTARETIRAAVRGIVRRPLRYGLATLGPRSRHLFLARSWTLDGLVRHRALGLPRTAALAIAALALTLGCSGTSTPGGYLSVATMRSEAAAELAPSGATILRTLSAEPLNNITGPQPGHYGHLFGTNLGASDVADFYARELPKLGWRARRPPIRASNEQQTWGWCKPKMLFRLATLEPRDDRAGIDVAGRFTLVFDARITDGDC